MSYSVRIIKTESDGTETISDSAISGKSIFIVAVDENGHATLKGEFETEEVIRLIVTLMKKFNIKPSLESIMSMAGKMFTK